MQRLPEARHVAVAEDPEAAPEEPMLHPVALDMLRGEEPQQRLPGGESQDSGAAAFAAAPFRIVGHCHG